MAQANWGPGGISNSVTLVHGRPKETVENVSTFDDPLDVSKMTRAERDALKRRLVAAYPDAARSL